MDHDKMKTISRKMSIYMGVVMSLTLSLVGSISSGHFTIKGYIISFIISTVISIMIGFVIPISEICAGVCRNHDIERHSLKGRLIESLISDVVYTPLLTLLMVVFNIAMVVKNSGGNAQIPFLPMFLHSLLICFPVGYVLIFIMQPVLLKYVLKKAGIDIGRPGDRD